MAAEPVVMNQGQFLTKLPHVIFKNNAYPEENQFLF